MQTSDQLTLFRPEGKEHDEIPHVTMRFMYYHVFVAHGVVCVCVMVLLLNHPFTGRCPPRS